jgi:hypothetical protein
VGGGEKAGELRRTCVMTSFVGAGHGPGHRPRPARVLHGKRGIPATEHDVRAADYPAFLSLVRLATYSYHAFTINIGEIKLTG